MAYAIQWCDSCNKEIGRVQKTGKSQAQIQAARQRIWARHTAAVHRGGKGFYNGVVPTF